MNDISNDVLPTFSMVPKTLEEAMKYADVIAASDFVPADYKGKPGNVIVAMQMGMEVGLRPLQALQNIAVINGRPSIWGDSVLALCITHPACEWVKESFDKDSMTATCRVKRRGHDEHIVTFGKEDAETAGIWGKNVHKTYPKRMLQMRARGFALRDKFPDALKGLQMAEELLDYPERDMGTAERVRDYPSHYKPGLQEYPSDAFEQNLPTWQKMVESGNKTPDMIITMIASMYQLNEEQEETIRNLGNADPKKQPENKSTKPVFPPDQFKKSLESWKDIVESGRKTSEHILAQVSQSYDLTEDQVAQINALGGNKTKPENNSGKDHSDFYAEMDAAEQKKQEAKQ